MYEQIGSGGMATVHIGRLLSAAGFSRTVAIKRLHPGMSQIPEFVSMLVDEARLAARIHHPNVVATIDTVLYRGELFLVMEYVHGVSLLSLAERTPIPYPVATAIVIGLLHGLHAAHEARDEHGNSLGIVHRDVSPANVLVGADGIPRVLDFGVAKASARIQTTHDGEIKGKIAYMAPEQLQGEATRQTDVYAAAVVFWEVLTGEYLFSGANTGEIISKILFHTVPLPSSRVPGVPALLEDVILRGLEREPSDRFATAAEMARELEMSGLAAPNVVVREWVQSQAGSVLENRARLVAKVERASSGLTVGDLDFKSPVVPVQQQHLVGNENPTIPELFLPMDLPVAVIGPASDIIAATDPTPDHAVGGLPPRERTASRKRMFAFAAVGVTLVVAVALIRPISRPSSVAQAAVSIPDSAPTTSVANASAADSTVPPSGPSDSLSALPTTVVPSAFVTQAPNGKGRTIKQSTRHKCIPPGYRFDSEGRKIWDRECLR